MLTGFAMRNARLTLVHREAPAEGPLVLDLLGPLQLTDAAGCNLTPRSRKAQGLLALIATAPGLRRSRAWVQDKLWSDRGQEQGSASLRQCLTEIRSALGRHVGCLGAEAGWIALDPALVRVRAELPGGDDAEEAEFLMGLDIRDPEFENWVRDQRLRFMAVRAPACDTAVQRARVALASAGGEVGGFVLDLVAHGLLRQRDVGVFDLRAGGPSVSAPALLGAVPEATNLLQVVASVLANRVRLTLRLSQPGSGLLFWTETATFGLGEFYRAESPAMATLVGRAIDAVRAHARACQAETEEATRLRPTMA